MGEEFKDNYFDDLINGDSKAQPAPSNQKVNPPSSQFQSNQIDLTGYLLHILVKICDILYLSVCQIPVPIRSFIKILNDSILKRNPKMSQ